MKNRSQFFRKIFFLFFGVTLCLALLLTTFFTLTYQSAIKKNVLKMSQKLLAQSDYSISYITGLVNTLSNNLYSNNYIVAYMNMKKWNNMTSVHVKNYLRDTLLPLSYVDSVYLYNGYHDTIYSTKDGSQLSSGQFADRYMADLITDRDFALGYDGSPVVYSTTTQNALPNVCSFISFHYDVDNGNRIINALIINIKLSELSNTIEAINTSNDKLNIQFLIMDDDRNFIVSSSSISDPESYRGLLSAIEKENYNDSFNFDLNGEQYFVVHNRMAESGWTLIGLFSTRELFEDTRFLWMTSLAVSFILLFSCALVGYGIAKGLSRPVEELTSLFQAELKTASPDLSANRDELKALYSFVSNMQEQNRQLALFQSQTTYTMRQEFLSNLISGNVLYPIETIKKNLSYLRLDYIGVHQLFMCLLKIDNYSAFQSARNPQERWASRFEITNIAAEIAGEVCGCETFSIGPKQFILLLDAEEETSYRQFSLIADSIIKKIQSGVLEHLQISLSAAYGGFFRGIETMHIEFMNLSELMELRLKYGYGCIINQNMLEDIEYDSFAPSASDEEALFSAVRTGNKETAFEALTRIFACLSPYSYDEIVYYVNHLSFSINENIVSLYQHIKTEAYKCFRRFNVSTQNAEVLSDIESEFNRYIEALCDIMNTAQNTTSRTMIIAQNTCAIVENKYQDKDLCHSSIASELGISSNYLGKVFKEVMGKTLTKYIMDCRMEKVGALLQESQYPIAEITEMVGIEYNNYFYSCFKRYYGKTLGQYKLDTLAQMKTETGEGESSSKPT